jgi:hypothetical protein
MSHATLLLVTENEPNEKEIEELMSPYVEYGSNGEITKYVKWVDETESLTKSYKEETRSIYKKLDDGTYHCQYDSDIFYREPTVEEAAQNGIHSEILFTSKDWGDGQGYRSKVKYTPEGYELTDALFYEIYSTFEEFLEKYHSYKESDFKNGKPGYYTNPNSKWDWYQIGGRWTGFFNAKNHNEAKQGEKSWTVKEEVSGVDIIQKKNIDIESMKEEAKIEADKYWEVLLKYYPDLTMFPQKSWSDCVDEYKNKNLDKFDRDAVIKIEENQENFNKETIQSLSKELNFFLSSPVDFFCKGNKDLFYKKITYNKFGTFAILKDDFWYQKGELGWFGTASNEDSNWEETFFEIFESINENHWLTLIDYHC